MVVEAIIVVGLASVGAVATLKGLFGAVAQAYAEKEVAAAKAEAAKIKTDVSTELTKVDATASADAKALVAKIKAIL